MHICMYNQYEGFEWDDEKAERNMETHRISFEIARHVFDDPCAVTFEDIEHSTEEERFATIGLCVIDLLFVNFAYRDERIRIISARRASKKMQRIYEDNEY